MLTKYLHFEIVYFLICVCIHCRGTFHVWCLWKFLVDYRLCVNTSMWPIYSCAHAEMRVRQADRLLHRPADSSTLDILDTCMIDQPTPWGASAGFYYSLGERPDCISDVCLAISGSPLNKQVLWSGGSPVCKTLEWNPAVTNQGGSSSF